MGSVWDRFGIDLGSVRGRFEIDVGDIWDHFGALAEIMSGKVLSGKVAPYIETSAQAQQCIAQKRTMKQRMAEQRAC